MFVGANHHLQCAVFGFALLGDETVEIFEWVFNAFKTCMGGEDPRGQKETNTLYEFEIKVARAYTRTVMNRFEESIKYATAYKIARDPDGGINDWVVQHTKRSNRIVWGQHELKVMADVEDGRYTCECKQWEHKGLFCVHLLRAFQILQIDRIPKEYVLQRYTNSARHDVVFSRDDKKLKGKDGETQSYRQKTMLKSTMKVINKTSMSKAGHDKYLDVMGELMELLERVEPDIGVDESCETSDVEGDLDEGVPVGDLREDSLRKRRDASSSDAGRKLDFAVDGISLEGPDRAKPKGRTIKETESMVLRLGAKGEKKKNRKCKKCGIADGHNSRTCLSVKENRDRLAKLGGRTRGRPPGSKNKSARTSLEWNETSASKKRQLIVSDDDESTDDSILVLVDSAKNEE
ncbi:hypothetical protein U9M48_012973 [Paspalum notatum var. saurae]|uniref:Protein FAR1-RELATED SEQUENCE n=1 Tax=Paspalum notatum var. saurae TaxID=547442 RepID=A0AAQ3SYQ7_PASNO